MEGSPRNVVLGAAAVVALGVAGYLFVWHSRAPKAANAWVNPCICLSCSKEADIRQRAGERDPFKCPSCDKLAAYPWLYCYDCKKRFIPQLVRTEEGGPLREPSPARCRICGGSNVGAYVAKLVGEHPGDAPLPEWTP